MPDATPRDLALAEFSRMERPRWSNDEWPRVVEAAERLLSSYERHAVLVALGSFDDAGGDKSE